MLSALFTSGPICAILGSKNSSSSSVKSSSSANSRTTSSKSRKVSPSTASSSNSSSQPMTVTDLAVQWLKSPVSPSTHDTPALLDRKYLKAHVLAMANLIPKSATTTYSTAENKEWNVHVSSLCTLITRQRNALLPTEGLSRDLKLTLSDQLQVSGFAVDDSAFFSLSHSHGGDKNDRATNLDMLLEYVTYAAAQLFLEREETKLALCKQRLERRAGL